MPAVRPTTVSGQTLRKQNSPALARRAVNPSHIAARMGNLQPRPPGLLPQVLLNIKCALPHGMVLTTKYGIDSACLARHHPTGNPDPDVESEFVLVELMPWSHCRYPSPLLIFRSAAYRWARGSRQRPQRRLTARRNSSGGSAGNLGCDTSRARRSCCSPGRPVHEAAGSGLHAGHRPAPAGRRLRGCGAARRRCGAGCNAGPGLAGCAREVRGLICVADVCKPPRPPQVLIGT